MPSLFNNSTIFHIKNEDIKLMLKDAAGRSIELAIMLVAFGPLSRGEKCGLYADCIHDDHITVMTRKMTRKNKNPLFKRVIAEQDTGVEPAYPAWEAGVLPMY